MILALPTLLLEILGEEEDAVEGDDDSLLSVLARESLLRKEVKFRRDSPIQEKLLTVTLVSGYSDTV